MDTTAGKVTENEIVLTAAGKETRIVIVYDNILVAAGMKAENELEEMLYSRFEDVFVVGDANRPGKILAAVHQGFHAARNML